MSLLVMCGSELVLESEAASVVVCEPVSAEVVSVPGVFWTDPVGVNSVPRVVAPVRVNSVPGVVAPCMRGVFWLPWWQRVRKKCSHKIRKRQATVGLCQLKPRL